MITYAGATLIADWFCGKTYNTRNGLYVGLSKTAPTVAGANVTEPSATTYARVLIAESTQYNPVNYFGNPVQGENGTVTVSNSKTIYFPETWNTGTDTGEDWGECTYVCLFKSGVKGTADLVAYQELATPIHPGQDNASTIPIIRIGDIVLSFGNPTSTPTPATT